MLNEPMLDKLKHLGLTPWPPPGRRSRKILR